MAKKIVYYITLIRWIHSPTFIKFGDKYRAQSGWTNYIYLWKRIKWNCG